MMLTPSKVRYISFQRNLQVKIHLSSYHFGERLRLLYRISFLFIALKK